METNKYEIKNLKADNILEIMLEPLDSKVKLLPTTCCDGCTCAANGQYHPKSQGAEVVNARRRRRVTAYRHLGVDVLHLVHHLHQQLQHHHQLHLVHHLHQQLQHHHQLHLQHHVAIVVMEDILPIPSPTPAGPPAPTPAGPPAHCWW